MSKELEALKCLRTPIYGGIFKNELDIIEKALKDYEELKSRENNVLPKDEFIGDLGEHTRDEVAMKLKALEIIKEKQVDVGALLELDLELYNKYAIEINGTPTLTHEEFDLIKKALL